jgi:predicted regulator of Ras-like GTPase activity (Roadblock/LC7/MglB family)
MTTTPTPTGKIKGSLRDVTPKLRNFVGAVKVTTPSGKGGILVDRGRTVASYLTQDGVLHRGKESLELLEKVELAEFEILRYDDDQFREAMTICDNRGLLLGEEKGEAPAAPPQAREPKPREETLLSSMMKRFAAPKIPEKQEPVRVPPKDEPEKIPPPEVPQIVVKERQVPEPKPPFPGEKNLTREVKREAPAVPPESDLSSIIKRLKETGRLEKGPARPGEKAEVPPPKEGAPEPVRKAQIPEPVPVPAEKPPAPGVEKAAPEPVTPVEEGTKAPEGQAPGGRVKVDLGKMMKRIKRLDITSIRKELEEGTGAGGMAAEGAAGAPQPAGESGASPEVPARAPPPQPEARGKSDIDELKAFIKRLEVLEEPKEPAPMEKGLLAKLGVKPSEEAPPSPARRETPAPVPRREKAAGEVPAGPVAEPVPEPPKEREAPRPAAPDRKTKIASLLRRSGLVKPPVEEQPKELVTVVQAEPKIPEEKVRSPAPAGEGEIKAPGPQRKKVEITRVQKMPETPLREPPLIDERMIQRILKQPGVIAVSTFFEGFAVQSAGRADFEQVAANAEDLFRAGKKIAREIDIGPLSQIILETAKGKLIIAPHGDLNVCIFTEPDANLGLIRVAIKGMQVEKA